MANKRKNKVAFQGEKGAYSEAAAFGFFGKNIKTIPCQAFTDVFRAIEKSKAIYGIIPIENSLEGTVGQNYDLLLKSKLKIFGETILRIRHCLIGEKGVKITSIKKVYSHPQALGQCRKFLERLKVKLIPFYDTAGSAKMIKEEKLKDSAGVASQEAAQVYNLKILKKGIETNPNNYTRFFIISKREERKTRKDKTSIVFSTKHKPGALFQVLKVFAQNNINLTKIESRPMPNKSWEYNFYLDFWGHQNEEKIKETLKGAKKYATFFKILGSYPRASRRSFRFFSTLR